jgi:hypothetical protein
LPDPLGPAFYGTRKRFELRGTVVSKLPIRVKRTIHELLQAPGLQRPPPRNRIHKNEANETQSSEQNNEFE